MADVDRILALLGTTYAEEAGITLRDQPSPLYRLSVLALLLSTRIHASIAVAAAAELSRAGLRTPAAMRRASWQDRVDALGRAHYRRYDESTATRLGDGAALLHDRWHDDLRRLRQEADGDAGKARALLEEFPGIGPTGSAIFVREVQGVWPELGPFADELTATGAGRLGLPATAAGLARRVPPPDLPRLVAACVRAALDDEAAARVR